MNDATSQDGLFFRSTSHFVRHHPCSLQAAVVDQIACVQMSYFHMTRTTMAASLHR